MVRASLIYYVKQDVGFKYIMELSIFRVKDKRFEHGIKYSLIFIEPITGEFVLFDNHHPKGHHFHINNEEFKYEFKNEEELILDYKKIVQIHFGVSL